MKTNPSRLIMVVAVFVCVLVVGESVSFTVSSASVTPNTARSTSSAYQFQLNAIGTFSTDFDISISFTNAFTLTTPTACSATLNASPLTTAICSATSNTLTFSTLNINTNVQNIILNFNTATAIYSGSFTITLQYYQPGNTNNVYNTSSTLLIINSAAMTCSLASTSNTVGATANYTLTYTPSAFISAASLLRITLPAWSDYTLTNFPSGTANTICGGICTVRNPNVGQGFLNQILTYSSLFATDTSTTTPLQMSNARNPASTRSLSVSVSLLHYISSTSQPSYMMCTATLQATTTGAFKSISFNPTSTAIRATNTISLFLSLSNPISANSYLFVSYGADLQLGYAYATSNQQTTQVSVANGIANSLLIGNLTNATSQVSSLFMASFTLTNPPYATLPNTITFLTQNLVSGTYYPIDTGTVSISSTPSTIITATATLSNSSIGAISNLALAFTSINSLVSGSIITITVPNEVTLTNGTTTCSSSIVSTCTLLTANSVQLIINAIVIAGGTNIPITISSITNPPTTTTTSSFTIITFYSNTSTPVDSLTTGLTVTAQPVPLQAAAISSSSTIVAAIATYTITITIKNPLPANSYLTMAFPSDFPTASTTLASLQTSGTTVVGCTMSTISTMKFNFSNCIPSNLPALSILTITLSNLINPGSTKPTSSLQLQTFSNNLLMQYLYTTLITTMTTPTTLTFSGLTPLNSITNANTNYSLAITFSQTHHSGDKVLLTIPSTISLNSGFICTTTTVGLTLACTKLSTQLLEVVITSTGTYTSAIITVTNFINNWYASTSSFSIQTTTNHTTTYYIQQGTATVTMTPAPLSITHTPSNSLTLLASSTLTLTITSPFTINAPDPTLLKIALTIPTDFTPTSTCSSTITGSICSLLSTTYSITGLSSFTNSLSLTFTATASYFSNTSNFISTLTYNNLPVATDSTFILSPYCTSPCKGCTTTQSQCTSCLPTPYTSNNYLFAVNSTCLTTCPATYYLPSGTFICQQCDSASCLNCASTATTCTACLSPYYLSNSTCVLQCPNTLYGSNTTCLPCINQCFNCTNATYCLTCSTGYSLNPDHTCLTTCPTGYISLSSICTQCTTPCATCIGSITNCQTCITNYILFNATCVLACPQGKYLDANSVCQNCVSPCHFCNSALSCISCTTNFFLYNSTQCVSICPPGTYGLTTSCQSCDATCQTCNQTSTSCSSCLTGEYLYAGKCYTQCPALTYPHQGQCTTCVSPCATCLNGAFSCSSCQTNYLLLNTSCVLTCPSSGYLPTSTSCVACPTSCVTCASSTSCLGCQSNFFLYLGGCVSSCPSTSPIIVNQECTTCGAQCATCSQSPSNCLTCTIFYFRYTYTCVQSCPLSYYSNQLTYNCQSGLSSKIVFFPVLITYIVILAILIVVKICVSTTSIPTALTAFSGWLELIIWCYLLSLIFASYLEPGLSYALPKALIFIAIFTTFICNFIHFKINLPRLQRDEHIRKWKDVNLNHSYFIAIRYISLFTHHKFFRLIYSKIFNSLQFSMVAFKRQNIFTISTAFTIIAFIASEVLVLAAAFYLAYNKLLKDQVFYTAIETLIVTAISILIALFDIYKSEDYFEDTQFMITKRYLEKVNNDSHNKLEDEYRMKDEGSIDGEKVMGTTGGKFIFSKRGQGQGSMGQLFFEEQSAATNLEEISKKELKIQIEDIQMQDNYENDSKSYSKKSPNSPIFSRTHKLPPSAHINIFQPIQQEQGEYYQALKYDQQDFKTAAKRQKQKYDGNNSEQENQLQQQRKISFGLAQTQKSNIDNIDDNRSLMEYRERKEEWNKIIDHRQHIANRIFNTLDSKDLYRIDEPLNEDQDERERMPVRQRVLNQTPQKLRRIRNAKQKLEQELKDAKFSNYKNRLMMEDEQDMIQEHQQGRRRKKRRKHRKGKKELQEIYLQRLAQKVSDPKRKTIYYSTKTYNFDLDP